jgi:hypothetical protein
LNIGWLRGTRSGLAGFRRGPRRFAMTLPRLIFRAEQLKLLRT